MLLRNKISQAILIDGFENTDISSSSSILTFKFCKRPARPGFLVLPSASASIASLFNQLNLWKESGEERGILRSSFDLDYLGVLCIACSLRRGTRLALRGAIRTGLPPISCFELI
jgi:hypothetical protein